MTTLAWQLILQVVLIALNAIFACAEIAVISAKDAKIAALAQEGNRRAIRLERLTSQPARFLATIQVAITLAGFLGSAFAADSFSEAVFIAKEIGRMTGGVDMLEAQALGHERTVRAFSDIAVLCRTHRQLELVEKCLRHDDIPCLVTGREDFLDDPAVRGALGFLRSLVVPADNAALESALRLLWNCPADLIQKAQTLCQKMGTLDSAALQEAVRGHGILENWLDRTEVWLPLVQTETPRKLVEQWEEQYGTSPALERLRNTAVFHEDFDSLWDALVLGQEADLRRASGKHWASGAVRLMTLHGAKGLEFPAVFLAGLSAGAMPLESPGRPADAEEERRLFFVGLTRAREELILTAAPEFSPFLRELPEPVVRETTGRRREAEQLRLF